VPADWGAACTAAFSSACCAVLRAGGPKILGDKAAELAKWWAQSASLAHPVQNFPAYSFMNDELARVFDLAFHKKATAKDALDEAQKNVDEEIKKTV
jgi:maltose-binding protein MalE